MNMTYDKPQDRCSVATVCCCRRRSYGDSLVIEAYAWRGEAWPYGRFRAEFYQQDAAGDAQALAGPVASPEAGHKDRGSGHRWLRASSKESPAEPFKRALGLCVRAIAGDDEVQVSYAPGKPEIDGKLVQLPEPSRVPSAARGGRHPRLGRQPGADGRLPRRQAAQPAGAEGRPGTRRVRGRRAGARRGAGRQPHARHGRQSDGPRRGPVRARPLRARSPSAPTRRSRTPSR